MMSAIVITAIVAAIALGYVTRINIGLFSIAFAYLIGAFAMDLKPAEIINMWPLSIFFIIFSVCLFYGFAITNGTLEKLSEHLLYRCRNFPYLLPYAIFLITALIAALGAGYYTVLAFMAPLTLMLCTRTGMSMIIGAMSVNYGALAGANFMSSQSGIIFRTLMAKAGIAENPAFINATGIFLSTMIIPFVVITVLVFFTGHRKAMQSQTLSIAKPAPFDSKQKATLVLTFLMMAIVLIVPVLRLMLPQNASIAFVNGKMDIGLIASIFSVAALFLKLGDERKVIATVPWGTIVMICGMGMLISVAIKAGTIQLLASWISTALPAYLVPVALGIVAAIMSLFSSTLGVVTPALFPIVPTLATSLSLDPMVLFIAIVVGAQATSISPFSSGGSLMLGACANDEARTSLFPRLLLVAAPLGTAMSLVFNVVLTILR